MARLERPHVPLSVRLKVARRQCCQAGHVAAAEMAVASFGRSTKTLRALLTILFGDAKRALDHNPALVNRVRVMKVGKFSHYVPDANDPDYLIYRLEDDHNIKTRVRGDGAQLSDLAIARKRKRKERKAKRPKHKWPKRRFTNG